MIINNANFVLSAVKPIHYPTTEMPEVAFAGRSNVGKSSLINKLLNRKKLVKTSGTPGRTRTLNFFEINGCFMFVDLPGYGYAKVAAKEQKKWGPMIESYIKQRMNLKAVVVILDIRRDAPGPKDFDLINWLKFYNIPMILVLTKSDKLSKTSIIKQKEKTALSLSEAKDNLIIFSAKSGFGKNLIWEAIENRLFRNQQYFEKED